MRLQVLQRLRDLQNKRLQIQLRELPPEVLELEPESPVELHRRSSTVFGVRHDATELLGAACNLLAQGKVPEKMAALMEVRLTALSKPNGGVGTLRPVAQCVGLLPKYCEGDRSKMQQL